jgi:hypothetical protein
MNTGLPCTTWRLCRISPLLAPAPPLPTDPGEKNGNLASSVSALEMITAAGDIVKLSRKQDGEGFSGAVVGLGTLGVITKITLDLLPTFMVKQYVYENLPLSEMQQHFDAIEASGYSVSLFTDWQKKRINEVWVKSRVEAGQSFNATPELFGAKLATRNLHPIAELSAENCTEQMGVPGPWYERLPHFRALAARRQSALARRRRCQTRADSDQFLRRDPAPFESCRKASLPACHRRH